MNVSCVASKALYCGIFEHSEYFILCFLFLYNIQPGFLSYRKNLTNLINYKEYNLYVRNFYVTIPIQLYDNFCNNDMP